MAVWQPRQGPKERKYPHPPKPRLPVSAHPVSRSSILPRIPLCSGQPGCAVLLVCCLAVVHHGGSNSVGFLHDCVAITLVEHGKRACWCWRFLLRKTSAAVEEARGSASATTSPATR